MYVGGWHEVLCSKGLLALNKDFVSIEHDFVQWQDICESTLEHGQNKVLRI